MAKIQLKSIPYKNYQPGHCYDVSEDEASAAVSDGAAIRLPNADGIRVSPAPAPWPTDNEAPAEGEITPPADDVPPADDAAFFEDAPIELTEEVKSEE